MLHRLWKPWFLYQPTWILKRAAAVMRPPPPGYRPIETSWGASITADPARTIGHSIATTGVHDIALSETPARLIAPGDTVVDAGANIGHATLLASLAAGPTGRVVAFEPHPALFEVLTGNINRAGTDSTSPRSIFGSRRSQTRRAPRSSMFRTPSSATTALPVSARRHSRRPAMHSWFVSRRLTMC